MQHAHTSLAVHCLQAFQCQGIQLILRSQAHLFSGVMLVCMDVHVQLPISIPAGCRHAQQRADMFLSQSLGKHEGARCHLTVHAYCPTAQQLRAIGMKPCLACRGHDISEHALVHHLWLHCLQQLMQFLLALLASQACLLHGQALQHLTRIW